MNDNDSHGQERDIGNRIASLIRAIGQGREKPITVEEERALKAAASRLDLMLKDAAEADRQALRNAAVRLDEMLLDMRKGKDITNRVKRRSGKD